MMQFEPPKNAADLQKFEEWLQHQKSELAKDSSQLRPAESHTAIAFEKENFNPNDNISYNDNAQPDVVKHLPMRKSYSRDGEALLFKLGTEQENRKKLYQEDVIFGKGHYDKNPVTNAEIAAKFQTNLSKDAEARSTHRTTPRPYFEVSSGGDIFSKRPSSAQNRLARKETYKNALNAQLASQARKNQTYTKSRIETRLPTDPTKHDSVTQHPSFQTIVNKPAPISHPMENHDSEVRFEDIRVPTPQEVHEPRSRADRRQSQSEFRVPPPQAQNPYQNGPPNGYYQPQYQPPPQPVYYAPQPPPQPVVNPSFDRLNSTLERATYELESNRNRINQDVGLAGYGHASRYAPQYAPPPNMAPQPPRIDLQGFDVDNSYEKNQKSVRISDAYNNNNITPRNRNQTAATIDHDIFNQNGNFGNNSSREDKQDYGRDLQRQMREREEKKKSKKAAENAYDLKMERAMQDYDPFGKGGGGAPVKDKSGRIMADLRSMRTLNNTVENNLDLVFELKDTEQKGVTTPRPPSHNRIEQQDLEDMRNQQNTGTRSHRITDMYEPKKKTDYEYRDYLEGEIRKKEARKQEKIAIQKAEDEHEELRIHKENEKLQFEKDQEDERRKAAKLEEKARLDAKGKSTQQSASFPSQRSQKEDNISDGPHRVTKAKVIQLDENDWQQKQAELDKRIREVRAAKNRAESRNGPSRNQTVRTPVPKKGNTNLHPPPTAHDTRSQANVRDSQESRATLKSKSENVSKRVTVKSSSGARKSSRTYKRESSSVSDISWDVRSVNSEYQQAPSRRQYEPPSRNANHYHQTHQPPSRVLSQLNQLKKQLQDEYMRVQYNLENGAETQVRSKSISSYPQPQYSLPPRINSSRSPPKQLTQHEIRQTTDKYLNQTEKAEMTAEELAGIKNDNDEMGHGLALDEETQWLDAPGETFNIEDTKPLPKKQSFKAAKDDIVTIPSTSETFDIEHHEKLNKERSRALDEITRSLEDVSISQDAPNGIREVNNSGLNNF